MKVGDLVRCWPYGSFEMSPCHTGVIIGFNKKGEGGKEIVHILYDNKVMTFLSFNVEVIHES